MQEVNCLVNMETGEVEEGSLTNIEAATYMAVVTVNSEPFIEDLGHSWLVVMLQKQNVHKQLV